MIALAIALQVVATPAEASKPSIPVEVRRGWAAAHACSGPKQWTPVMNCLTDAIDKNRKANNGARGFGLGVTVATWAMARAMLPSLAADPKEADYAASSAKLARVMAEGRARRLGLTDADAPTILPINAAEWSAAAEVTSPAR